MNWLKRIATNSIENIILGVIMNTADINYAVEQLEMIGSQCCEQITAMSAIYPAASAKMRVLSLAAGCENQDQLQINEPTIKEQNEEQTF